MGQYLIPGAFSVMEAIEWRNANVILGEAWSPAEGGVLFSSPTLTDAEAAAAYEGFVPSVQSDAQWPALPDAVRTHLQHLRDYRDADPATVTSAQTVHVVKDLIRAVFFLNSRYETEG